MKRALVINYEFPPLGGGGGVAALTIAKGLIKQGYEIDYVTTGYKDLPRFETVQGIHVYRVRVPGRSRVQTSSPISLVLFPFAAIWRTFKLCFKYKYEFMHTHFVVPTGPLSLVASKLFRIKNLIFIHGGDIYDPTRGNSCHRSRILRIIIRFLMNHADAVITQSKDIRDHCINSYRPKKDIQIIPLPYILREFKAASKSELGLSEDKKYIIGIGRLIKRKDFKSFINVLARLDTSIEGIIIGNGPEYDNLVAAAESAGVASRMHFMGQVSEDRKFQYLSNSDVFLLTSVHEGFGIVIQEAMQVGLPVVATDQGGQKDFIEQGVNGFFSKVGDVESLTANLQMLLNNGALMKEISENNKAKIYQFDLGLICARYLNISNSTREVRATDAFASPVEINKPSLGHASFWKH